MAYRYERVPHMSPAPSLGSNLVEESNRAVFEDEIVPGIEAGDRRRVCSIRWHDMAGDTPTAEEGDGALVVYVRYAFSEAVFVDMDCPDLADVVNALHDYPLLDESDHSERETEYAAECWEDYDAQDFARAIVKALDEDDEERGLVDQVEDADSDALALLHHVSDPGERYPETGDDPVWWDEQTVEAAVAILRAGDWPSSWQEV